MILCLLSCSKEKQTSWIISSPGDKITVTVLIDSSRIFYKAAYSGKDSVDVIGRSRLGIVRKDQSFAENLKFISATTDKTVEEDFDMLTGKRSHCKQRFSERELTFENENGKHLTVVFRICDTGVAFRYLFPEKDTSRYVITDEITEFNIPGDGKAWMQPYEKPNEWGPAYEMAYVNGVKAGTPSRDEGGWSFPALFQADNNWMLITEANIDGSFYGAHLKQNAPNGIYTIALPQQDEALGLYDVSPVGSLPWATPWRVIMSGKSLGAIVESTLVQELSAPSRVKDVSWIKPGRSSWSWWSDHTSSRDYKKMTPFIDFASEMGWEYSLIDANWNVMKNGEITQLVSYAKSKNVGLFLWYNSGGPHTKVTEEPRDIISDPEKRKAEFKKLHDWGVRGVKVDFFNSDKPDIMQYYQDILKDAADNQLMVLFHGCTLPRGWDRTYPNLMSMEGVRGAEQYWDTVFAENAQTHHTILACTRNVVGSMDYTPVTFTNSEVPHLTTYAHELALAVLFESGVTHFADRVSGYKSLPAEGREFLKRVPTTWDEIKFVQGYPGKEMVIARRKGDNWFVAGVNGEKSPRQLSIDLSFITGDFTAILIQDGKTAKDFNIQEKVDYKKPIDVNLLPRGGFLLQLIKQ